MAATFFPVGTPVTVSSGEHVGKKGKVLAHFGTDGYASKTDVPHLVVLDEPITVPDGAPNPQAHGPQGPLPYSVHGGPLPNLTVTQIEVLASCLS